ncbi:MAG TPA: hypothetical protein VGJ64_05105 [Gemmatimonadaceae bacterium]|jgi:hypothetical protein
MGIVYHEAPQNFKEQFVAAGYRARHFFPHRFHYLPKCGPDGLLLAESMCGVSSPEQLWQIVLYASSPAIDEFPRELFFDQDIVWHQQHFNRVGQVASVDIALTAGAAFTMAHQSDLVQRISRRRELKTRVEKVFQGWHHLLLNAAAAFAADRGVHKLRVPSSRLAMENTDKSRHVQPELFERVYDRAVNQRFVAEAKGRWWSVDIARNRGAIVMPERRTEQIAFGKTVCICHDIERGIGHRGVDPEFARRAEGNSPAALAAMLDIEAKAGIATTYAVVGSILPEIRDDIERRGHCIAFHSFDHDTSRDQLEACRGVDYRIKGYRPPQSLLRPELLGTSLHRRNFEWLATSVSSLGFEEPRLENRLVKIPILDDDFELHRGVITFEEWSRRSIDAIRNQDFVALSLHDCYASHWLPHYQQFLEEVKPLARLRTLDEVSGDLFIAGGI